MQCYLYNLATDRNKGFIAGVFKFFLFILSVIYSLAIRGLAFIYQLKPYRLNCKVISVGNITLGGTGKTPLVELIARDLKEQGHNIAILSRGYKRADEPDMLSRKLNAIPVIVDADRIKVAKQAIKAHRADTVILDDGFQQWRIEKDLEIVTVDSTCAFGNKHMLPRGILREPLSALRRADIFVLTKTNLVSDTQDIKYFLGQINPPALIVESIHSPVGLYELGKEDTLSALGLLRGKTVTLFCGIADPCSFEDAVKRFGIDVALSFKFPDHYHYRKDAFEKIASESKKKNIDIAITTEKDAARIYGLRVTGYGLRVLVLRIELKFTENEEEFRARLHKLYLV